MIRKHPFRTLAVTAVILIILGALLFLDLSNRGLAWQFFWSQTGEEEPLGQVRAMVELGGNLIRPGPRLDPFTPIEHANVNPYGINTFLQKEVEIAKVEAQLKMISEAGITWIRQEFPWEDIEIHGRGDYEDRRNVEAIGVRPSWEKYDFIVDLAEEYGIQIQARLSNPPAWSRAEDDPRGFGPPDDLQDFVNFAVVAAERYKGRIQHYQIWNEPNIFPEWGVNPDSTPEAVSPERYTEMLCRTYDALKAVDPEIVVISAALSPTSALSERDLNDFVYLQRMYDAGAAECFDVLSMQGYGLFSGPTDRRMRPTTVNFSRNLYVRDLMVANGDANKAIWVSEAAWNPVPTEEEFPEPIDGRLNFGQVTPEQAARYMPLGYQRAQEEWPWMGVINYWFFTRADDSERFQSWYYFRMVEPDYSPEKPTYTPLPIYESMREYITSQQPTLYPGLHQVAGHWAIETGEVEQVAIVGAHYQDVARLDSMDFVAGGTNVWLRWQGESIDVAVNDEARTIHAEGEGWHFTPIAASTLSQTHTIQVSAEDSVVVDSVTVMNRTFENLVPFVAIGLAIVALIVTAFVSVRSR